MENSHEKAICHGNGGYVVFNVLSPLKRAQTGLARGIAGSDTIQVHGHEVYCSEGKVCAEVEVLAIGVEDRDGGKVKVTLKKPHGKYGACASSFAD